MWSVRFLVFPRPAPRGRRREGGVREREGESKAGEAVLAAHVPSYLQPRYRRLYMGRGRLVDRLRRLFTRHSRRVVSFSSLTKERDPIVEEAEELFGMLENEFFTEYGEASRYHVQEVIGKGSYGVVGAAIDTHTGEKVAIKKINEVFEHVSDATRILREIKLLRLLRHPDIVEIKHIMLPPSRREFKDIYVVFELMESDLHQVIKANDDLTPEHHQFFLYQLLRALKYIHAG
ncbi:hypothetical protein B296_00024411 [Ensete ventricosum]|uniref:Protein kinase domain-containing protein n=1 Tax=Ensete ventricosum TaxID=4639 RepID=A0A427AU43_ENSVE|nr:hypothetical protein B296_00024411 [Ensete ventricosum]